MRYFPLYLDSLFSWFKNKMHTNIHKISWAWEQAGYSGERKVKGFCAEHNIGLTGTRDSQGHQTSPQHMGQRGLWFLVVVKVQLQGAQRARQNP